MGRWRAGLGAQWGEENYPEPRYGRATARLRRRSAGFRPIVIPARTRRDTGEEVHPDAGSARGRRGHYAWSVEFRVLGTIEVAGPAPSLSPPGAKERAILARLLIDAGRTVPADALLDAGWDDVPREVAARSLAVRVANLRAFLEPGRERGAPSSLLVREGPGYRLAVEPSQVDAHRFERAGPRRGLAAARRRARGARARARPLARARLRRPGRRASSPRRRSAGSRTSGRRRRPRTPARSSSSAARSRRSPSCAVCSRTSRSARSSPAR